VFCLFSLPPAVCLQESFQSGSSAAQQGNMEAARQHAAVVSAALGTLGGFVEWAPMGRLCAGSVVEACSFFLGVPDFRDAALAVVKQVGMHTGQLCISYCGIRMWCCSCIVTGSCCPTLMPVVLQNVGRKPIKDLLGG
jgi:hypothetical protein